MQLLKLYKFYKKDDPGLTLTKHCLEVNGAKYKMTFDVTDVTSYKYTET